MISLRSIGVLVLQSSILSFGVSGSLTALPKRALKKITNSRVTAVSHRPLMWDWDTICVTDVHFPSTFGWGVASSAFQMEGSQSAHGKTIENSWTESDRAPSVGNATGHWDRYKEDVQLIKQAGLKEYRFSIKWSAIEPACGVFDYDALEHYSDLIDELRANDITPFVMLFHHEWPAWFGQLGDFQKAENIQYFTEYAQYVFSHLHTKVSRWLTFNEPSGYALQAYYMGKYPPYVQKLKVAGTALKNMLDAHVELYHEFKDIDPSCHVGLAHMCVPLDCYPTGNPFKKAVSAFACSTFGHLQNNVALNYVRTGRFEWGLGCHGCVRGKNKRAKGAIDFLALNYYSNALIDGTSVTSLPDRPTSDDGKALYPEGLLRSIKLCAKLLPGVPLWIGENGICDEHDTLRDEYFKKHIWVVSHALELGYDIRGYHVWTLLDTYEWNNGYTSKYGLYKVDFDTYERTLRDGARSVVALATRGSYE